MTATLADYIVVQDSSFSLRPGEEKTFEFHIPSDRVNSGTSKRPIVSFFADPSSNAKNLKCEYEINDQEVGHFRYSGGTARGHSEVIRHNDLDTGKNTIQFRVESGEGSVNISDIVIWHQRNI